MTNPVIVVGAGLSGLTCARVLHEHGQPVLVLERDRAVGGRVQTDEVDGFRLDRGFQILLTGYPELRRHLDLDALDLRGFDPGAVLWNGERFETIGDPTRDLGSIVPTLLARAPNLRDKVEVLRLRRDVLRGGDYDALETADCTTLQFLQSRRFSPRFIEQFFRPFLGGVFLESKLETSARFFRFVFRMFSSGEATVPALGMGEIPRQLAAGLPEGAVRLEHAVAKVRPDGVTLEDGTGLDAAAVVVATEASAASRLLPDLAPTTWRGVTCFYFATDHAPTDRAALHLNATGGGVINNLHVPSVVSGKVAPAGKHLVSVTCLDADDDPETLRTQVLAEAAQWFGDGVRDWTPLRHYRIRHALPGQPVGALEPPRRRIQHDSGLFMCGDYLDQSSIDGAMVSGRRAAEAVAAALRVSATG